MAKIDNEMLGFMGKAVEKVQQMADLLVILLETEDKVHAAGDAIVAQVEAEAKAKLLELGMDLEENFKGRMGMLYSLDIMGEKLSDLKKQVIPMYDAAFQQTLDMSHRNLGWFLQSEINMVAVADERIAAASPWWNETRQEKLAAIKATLDGDEMWEVIEDGIRLQQNYKRLSAALRRKDDYGCQDLIERQLKLIDEAMALV